VLAILLKVGRVKEAQKTEDRLHPRSEDTIFPPSTVVHNRRLILDCLDGARKIFHGPETGASNPWSKEDFPRTGPQSEIDSDCLH
jgi:hypothetical protein